MNLIDSYPVVFEIPRHLTTEMVEVKLDQISGCDYYYGLTDKTQNILKSLGIDYRITNTDIYERTKPMAIVFKNEKDLLKFKLAYV